MRKPFLGLFIFSFALALTACGLSLGKTVNGVLSPTAAHATATAMPAFTRIAPQAGGLALVRAEPAPAAALPIRPTLAFTFNQPLDRASLQSAWRFVDSKGQAVPGKVSWRDDLTFVFTPATPLKPNGAKYRAEFTTALRSKNGASLASPLSLTYVTAQAFAVNAAYPLDGSDNVPVNADITIVFNKPVVPLTQNKAAATLPLRITPSVEGSGRWVSSAVYVFHPSHHLKSNSDYLVSLPAGVRTVEGDVLPKGFSWRFHTESVVVNIIDVSGDDILRGLARYVPLKAPIKIYFSAPMNPDAYKAVVVMAPNGGNVPHFTPEWDSSHSILTLKPDEFYDLATTYTVSVNADARAADGSALLKPVHGKFRTVGKPWIEDTPSTASDVYSPWVFVEFNTFIDEKSLEGHITVQPEPTHGISYEVYGREVHLGIFDPATEYTVTFAPGIADVYGNQTDAPITFTFRTAPLKPSAYALLLGQLSIFHADQPQIFYLRYANLDSVTFTLYSLDDQALLSNLADWEVCHPEYNPNAKLLGSMRVDLSDKKDSRFHYLTVDLAKVVGHSLAPGAYCLGVTRSPARAYSLPTDYYQIAVSTESLTFKASPANALAWATGLSDGAPVGGLKVNFYTLKDTEDEGRVVVLSGSAVTNGDGVALVDGLESAPLFALVHDAKHFAIASAAWTRNQAPGSISFWDVRGANPSSKVAFIYTDRPLYRPGQQIFFKGILRQDADLHYTIPHDTRVVVSLSHAGKVVDRQTVSVSSLGTFHGSFLLSDSAPVGGYYLNVLPEQKSAKSEYVPRLGSRFIRVANYHKPVFEVRLTPNPADVAPGQRSEVSLQASYYAGDAVADADVSWKAITLPFYFSPPRAYRAYTFSAEPDVPWLWYWEPERHTASAPSQNGTGKTDAQGKFTFSVSAPQELKNGDEQISVWATVTDRGGNSADGHTVLVSRVSNVYPGLKLNSWLGIVNQPLGIDFVLLNPQGEPLADHALHLDVFEEKWHSVQRLDASGVLRWENSLEIVPVADLGDFTTNADGRGEASFTPDHAGTYRIVATAADDSGRERKAVMRVWVLSADEALMWGESEAKTLPLIPDRASYRPGDVAHIVVTRPFSAPVYALMTEERGKIYSYRLLKIDSPSTTVDLPVKPWMAPVAYVSVVEVSGGDAKKPPDYRLGVLRLPVALEAQRLNVTVMPEKPKAAPGETVKFKVRTTDYAGKPVSAEVSLALVDKALLALAPDNYNLLEKMYSERALRVVTTVSLSQDELSYNLKAMRILPTGLGMGGGGKGADQGGVITVRELFRDTAYWKADLRTNEQGEAEVSITLPDNMTTWVMHARAITADSRVGSAISKLKVTLPFFVRLHTPAFFTAGDEATLSAVLHNSTDKPLNTEVTLSKAKGLSVKSPLSQKVEVPPKGQAVVSWQVEVPLASRRVDLEVQAVANGYRDASRPVLTLLPDGGIPVFAYKTVETVGLAGVLPKVGAAREYVQPPTGEHYTLRVNLAASLIASVASKLSVKPEEPTECIPYNAFALLKDVAILRMRSSLNLQAAKNDPVKDDALKRLQALLNYRRSDGTWGWCVDDDQSEVMPTAYALDALQAARAAGFPVDSAQITQPAEYLSRVLVRPQQRKYLSLDDQVYIVDVLARSGRPVSAFVYELAKKMKNSPPDRVNTADWAMLLRAAENAKMGADFTKPIVARLENSVTVSASAAHWDKGEAAWWSRWSSPLTATALAVDALLKADPRAPFLQNAVRWLAGRYNSSPRLSDLSDSTILRTLSDWAAFSHEGAANYDYAVFLGGKPATSGHMAQADLLTPKVLTWDEKRVPAGKLTTLDIQRGKGDGVLYYTAYLELTLPADEARAHYAGFSVDRAYYLVSDLDNPVTSAKVGDLVQVRLTVVVPHSEDNVVLTDYLPAGLEPLSGKRPEYLPDEEDYSLDKFRCCGWGGWFFGHREVYYDHVLFHAMHLPAGTYTVVYYARAATPGTFKARPAVVWDSFFPDVRGNTDGAAFTVLGR